MPTTSSVSRLRSALNRPATASPADAGVDGVELLQSKPSTRRGSADHHSAFYLEALQGYAERRPGRFHVPGHKGGVGTDPALIEALGEDTLSLDVPMIIGSPRRLGVKGSRLWRLEQALRG
jgi:hypothetical protein